MCGISGIFGNDRVDTQLPAMIQAQRHRGPDAQGHFIGAAGSVGLGHNRLSIIDLSPAGSQPMCDPQGRFWIVFNGEIYNYPELRAELCGAYPFRSQSDTEVLLAAYLKWGARCLDKLIGMFAFAIWDETERVLFAARDRFGVKPLYHHRQANGGLLLASEIKALHAAGIAAVPDESTWATYLTQGLYDHAPQTFWHGIKALPAGHTLQWQDGRTRISCWYDPAERVGPETDPRPVPIVAEEYLALLKHSVRLRFRADVPVGINLSGGLDSSLLLGLVQGVQGQDNNAKAFTFTTGSEYDESEWVARMLAHTNHPSVLCRLRAEEVPELAQAVQDFQDEPFGGLPTLAYARLFERARAAGVTVLLDGNGMDEQWAGYDYYATLNGHTPALVQGIKESAQRPECLTPEFRALAAPFEPPRPFADQLRNTQYRDLRYTKITRALRFNDRISMRSSTELREPFLDHRLVELALRQPAERKLVDGVGKHFLRQLARPLLPAGVVEAPKRALQTPQREWLRGPLRSWATECIETALQYDGGARLNPAAVRAAWQSYCAGASDNSFYVWQWISLALLLQPARTTAATQ